MKTVPLHGKKAAGRVVRIDDGDYELVGQYTWYVYEAKRPNRRTLGPYAMAPIWRDGKWTTIRMHTLITGYERTDHIDHDGLNNQRSNLRPATPGQNMHNMRAHHDGLSRYKGVSWSREIHSWIAQICVRGHSRRIGRYLSEEDAARAYDAAALEAFGEFACINFPEDPSRSPVSDGPAMASNRDGWVPSATPIRPGCKKCGGPLSVKSKTGICTRNPKCAAENRKLARPRWRAKPEAA